MARYRKRTNKKQTMKQIAHKEAQKVVNKNIETKMFDSRVTPASVTSTGSALRMLTNYSTATNILQNVGDSSYIGTAIKPVGIMLRLSLVGQASGALSDYYNKFSVCIWQNVGLFNPAGNTMSAVYESTGNSEAPLSAFNRQFNNRMRVLYRKELTVGAVVENYDGSIPHEKQIKVYIPARKLRGIKFSDAAGNVEKGDIWLGIVSDSGVIPHPSFSAYWRVYYQDA